MVIHDVSRQSSGSTIVHIENGHVSGRKVGDGRPRWCWTSWPGRTSAKGSPLCYLTRTPDGKILKSSSLYIRNRRGGVTAIFSINYDVSGLMMIQNTIGDLLSTQDKEQTEPERIINVNHVLDELIEQSVAMVGKPVALMNKDDKVRAIRFLNEAGAFLVTKSGDKVAKYFGISKYTLYSYIDANKDGDK